MQLHAATIESGTLETTQQLQQRNLDTWKQAGPADFASWQLTGTRLNDKSIQLDSQAARQEHDPYVAGSYNGGNYYNGGSYYKGEASSPWHSPAKGFDSAIASWNANTVP